MSWNMESNCRDQIAHCEETEFQLATIHTLWRLSLQRWEAERQHNYIQRFFLFSSVKYHFFLLLIFIFSFVMGVVVFKCAFKQTLWREISQISRHFSRNKIHKIQSLSATGNNIKNIAAENLQEDCTIIQILAKYPTVKKLENFQYECAYEYKT